MSAFGTKKRGADTGLQLTFPDVFQDVYHKPLQYFNDGAQMTGVVAVGDDFQSAYHEQKRIEANRSVMNGLIAKRTQERLLLTGHQNYHLPKPVLTQRVFANSLNGSQSLYSARQDGSVDAPFQVVERGMRGGVLRSAEGQAYARKMLDRRLEQLNKIDALSRGQPVEMGSEKVVSETDFIGDASKVEFNLLRQTIIDALTTGRVGNFTFADVTRLMLLLFRYAPKASVNELEDIVAGFDTIVESVRSLLEETPDVLARMDVSIEYLESISILMEKARQYSVEMNKGVFLSDEERIALSKALVRSLGFTKLLRMPLKKIVETEGQVNQRVAQEDLDDNEDNNFTRLALPREDEEQGGIARQPFAGKNRMDNRDVFGSNSGAYKPDGKEETSYFGEPTMVMPITADNIPESTLQSAETAEGNIRDAIMETIKNALVPLGFQEGENITEFVNANYPDVEQFFQEVEAPLLSQGITQEQLNAELQKLGEPIFEAYISQRNVPITEAVEVKQPVRRKIRVPKEEVATTTIEEQKAKIELPKSRAELDANYKTIADYNRLGAEIGRILGGAPVEFKDTTSKPNARRYLIYNVLQKKVGNVKGYEQYKDF